MNKKEEIRIFITKYLVISKDRPDDIIFSIKYTMKDGVLKIEKETPASSDRVLEEIANVFLLIIGKSTAPVKILLNDQKYIYRKALNKIESKYGVIYQTVPFETEDMNQFSFLLWH